MGTLRDIALLRKGLEYFDLLGRKAQKKKENEHTLVLFCLNYSTYAKQLIHNLKRYAPFVKISLITGDERYRQELDPQEIEHIYCFKRERFLLVILLKLKKADCIHTLWMEETWVRYTFLLRKKAKRLVIGIGGSDFYRADTASRERKRKMLDAGDCIIAETSGTRKNFLEYYGPAYEGKMAVNRFGIEVLEYMDAYGKEEIEEKKMKMGLPDNKIIVVCGHNAYPAHQHKDMLEAIKRLEPAVKEAFHFVFPMTYPSGYEPYIREIEQEAEAAGISCQVLTEFMDFREIAAFERMCDVMIHVQTTDQLSSAMLEHMYNNEIIIAGSWLPYESLRKRGIFFLSVEKIEDLKETLEKVFRSYGELRERCKGNHDLVHEMSLWKNTIKGWYYSYFLENLQN